MTTPPNTGPASIEELQELHRLLAAEMLARLKSAPSGELLNVARSFLRDNGRIGLVSDDKDRRALQRLYSLYVRQLRAALEQPQTSASVLSEARLFLQAQGIEKNLGAAIDTSKALAVLDLAALPFTSSH